MSATPIISQLPARYRFISSIGEGTMGRVARAYDRLTDQLVALKQVLLSSNLPPETIENELLLLAHEFRVLAGLRHPHIISVIDYGFDAERHPFYTMELLESGTTILEVGHALPLAGKVDLLLQALEALAYLHRRGVLHHDLKPKNMLVEHGRVRLLDFGLSVLASQPREDDAFGTLQYLAPEVLDGQPYSAAADLYSLGVIAYELLVGRYPFDTTSTQNFLAQVYAQPPDLRPLADQPALTALLGWLLAKEPAARPPSAQAAITALRAAAGQGEHTEDLAIRESYLQAAAFVGRERELSQLAAALEQARTGRGAAFLVGGESGVGKSRLLDELRTQALVGGFQVLRGQGVAEGGSTFQLWRGLVRHLALATPLDALEASVLKEITPDLEHLLGHDVADAPSIGSGAQPRLVSTLVQILARQAQPTLLLLEDLQWVTVSLEPIKQLAPQLAQLPLLVIGSYRVEERPELPAELPAVVQHLRLARLSDDATAELATSVLGAEGQQAALVQRLQAETEGNVFFMVELLRAWAEQAGGLEQIRSTSLSEHMLTGRMAAAVRRRLSKVPADQHALLLVAAIAGRELDLAVLGAISSPDTLAGWLQVCSEATVLEVAEQRWRFAHDKLREVLLQDADPTMLVAGHAQVAQAIERVYPDTRIHAPALAEHWRAAGHVAKEIDYSVLASAQLYWVGSYAEVERLAQRVLAEHTAIVPTAAQIQLLKTLGASYRELDRYPESIAVFREGLALARATEDPAAIVQFLNNLGWSLWRHLQYSGQTSDAAAWAEAAAYFLESYPIAEALGDLVGMAHSIHNQGIIVGRHDTGYRQAVALYRRSLALFEQAQDTDGISMALSDLASSLILVGETEQAQRYAYAALAQAQAIGDSRGIPFIYFSILALEIVQGNWSQVAEHSPHFAALVAAPDHHLHWGSVFYAAALAYHQRDDLRARQLSAASLHATAGFLWPIWLVRCMAGAVALAQADRDGLRAALRSALVDASRTERNSLPYLLLLAAGVCLLDGDVARGAAWLGCYEAHAAALAEPTVWAHMAEVVDRIRTQFADDLATPRGQAGRAAGAQIAAERVQALFDALMAHAHDEDQLLSALELISLDERAPSRTMIP